MQQSVIRDKLNLYNKYTCDYRQQGSTRYKDFSPYSPFDVDDVNLYLSNYRWNGDRTAICSILSKHMADLGATEQVRDNLKLLEEKNTLAVVTGHQPSLCGGPLFVLLKIASSISLARKLNAQNTEYNFVPVFWVATEDHNFSEYNSISYYDKTNDLFTGVISGDTQRLMAAARNTASNGELAEILRELPETEFLPGILEEVLSCNSGNLGESFMRLINTWFGRFGLLIIEPGIVRNLAEPLVAQAVNLHEKMVKNMNADTAEMQELGYKPQLPDAELSTSFLFYIENGQRYRIQYRQKQYFVEELDIILTKEELLQKISQHPQNFSPVAGLRPIIQGAILPVGIYVAGGGELAYHVQLRRNFKEFKVDIPLLLPRLAGTFVTPSIRRLLQKFSIAEDEILSGDLEWEVVQKELLRSNSQLREVFTGYAESFLKVTQEMVDKLESQQVKGYKDLQRDAQKYLSRFENKRDRLLQNNSPLGENAKNQFFRLYKFLLPAQKYQELTIAGIYFYNLLGRAFFDTICETDVLTNDHKLWIFD